MCNDLQGKPNPDAPLFFVHTRMSALVSHTITMHTRVTDGRLARIELLCCDERRRPHAYEHVSRRTEACKREASPTWQEVRVSLDATRMRIVVRELASHVTRLLGGALRDPRDKAGWLCACGWSNRRCYGRCGGSRSHHGSRRRYGCGALCPEQRAPYFEQRSTVRYIIVCCWKWAQRAGRPEAQNLLALLDGWLHREMRAALTHVFGDERHVSIHDVVDTSVLQHKRIAANLLALKLRAANGFEEREANAWL